MWFVDVCLCKKCYELQLLGDSAVLRAEQSNKQEGQTFGSGSTHGLGRRTYWLCQGLKQKQALQKTEEKEMLTDVGILIEKH